MWPAIIGSVVGGLLSGSGKSGSQTTKQELDPAMRPFIFGDGGLVPSAQGLFQKMTSPGYMQGYDTMRERGQQLLGGSVAGNPFASGYTGGGLFGNAGKQHMYTPPAAPPQQPPQQQGTGQQDLLKLIQEMQAEQLRQYLMQQFMSAGNGEDGGAAAAAATAAGIGTDGGGGSAM